MNSTVNSRKCLTSALLSFSVIIPLKHYLSATTVADGKDGQQPHIVPVAVKQNTVLHLYFKKIISLLNIRDTSCERKH